MQRKVILLVVFLIIVAVSGVGCYTILTHPRVEGEERDAIEHTGRYYREHCTDCHGDYHSYPYGFYYGYYPDYYWSNPRWGRYYAYPWWWDRYWWDDDGYYDGEEVEPEGAEKAERRRGLPPPYVRPEVTSSQPFVVPDPTKDTGSTTVDKEDKHVPKRIEQPETNKEEPKKEKPTRRRTD